MNGRKLRVGQVIFVLQSSQMKLIPAQVTEEINRKKIDGETVQYYVRFGTDPDAKTFLLDFNKVSVFETIQESLEFLLDNARASIEQICNEASDAASIFGEQHQVTKENVEKSQQAPVRETVKILLDNGEVANVRV